MKRVEGEGSRTAHLVLVGEAPGEVEEALRKPFVGPSGEQLTSILLHLGINRESCYITNVVKVKPPDNDLKRLPEIGFSGPEDFYDELYKEIGEIKPNVIVCLGAVPLEAFTGQTSITKYRGSIFEWRGIKVIPTIHPSNIFRMYQWKYLIQRDLKLAYSESEFPEIRLKEREYIIDPTFTQIIDELQRIKREKGFLVIDLETYMKSGAIKMVGLATSDTRAFCIPLVKAFQPIWSFLQEREIWVLLSDILLDDEIKKIAQHAQFEMTQLRPYTDGQMKVYFDTMRAHGLLYPEFPHDLAFLTSIYTDIPYYKDEGKASNTDYDALKIYNCKDCVVTYEIAMKEMEELKNTGLYSLYHEFDNPLMHELWKMSIHGVKIDKKAKILHSIKVNSKIKLLQECLNNKVGHTINVKSSKQIAEFLYTHLGLPKKYHRKTKNLTTDADALIDLYKKYRHPELKLLISIRELRTLNETFIDGMKTDTDGKIHTTYGITETGRLSSGQDIFGSGANLQNIPKGIRNIFIPSQKDMVIIKGDLSQAEARIVAWLAEEPLLKRAFKEGKSIHKFVCSLIFGIPEDKVNKSSKEYNLAKNMVHASNYDVSPQTFATHVDIPLKRAKEIMNLVDKTFPNIRGVFHQEIKDKLQRDRTLINPFGRKRVFSNRWGGALFREAYAFIPQSTVADVINRGIIRLTQILPEGTNILMQVHDEIVIESPEIYTKEVIRLFRQEVEVPFTVKGDILLIPLEIGVGKNWRETENVGETL